MIRSISDIENKHRGSEAFLLGSGASLDYYPDGFFTGRLTVGINLVCRRWPCKYSVTVHHEFIPELLEHDTHVVASEYKHCLAELGTEHFDLLEKDSLTHYTFPTARNGFGELNKPEHNGQFASAGTGTIPALEFCRWIGVRTVYLCGIDGRSIGGQTNYDFYGQPAVELERGYIQHLEQTRHLYHELIASWCGKGPQVVGLNPFLDFNSIPA